LYGTAPVLIWLNSEFDLDPKNAGDVRSQRCLTHHALTTHADMPPSRSPRGQPRGTPPAEEMGRETV
jgi:hypothetical protein